MSKKQKQLKRFLGIPKDLEWDEFVSVLKGLGFECHPGKGSRRAFHNARLKATLFFHEPHPQSIVKDCYIKDAINKLREYGILT